MQLTINELLFFGGLAAAGVAVIGMLIFVIISKKNKDLLDEILDAEYGED